MSGFSVTKLAARRILLLPPAEHFICGGDNVDDGVTDDVTTPVATATSFVAGGGFESPPFVVGRVSSAKFGIECAL